MTTQTSIRCPECGLPWNLIAGKFPLHTVKGNLCLASGREPGEAPLLPADGLAMGQVNRPSAEPPAAPVPPADQAVDTKPARKTRSDKGTKRRPRTEGGDSHDISGPNRTESGVQAAPGGPAEPGQPNELATSNRLPTHPEPAEGPSPAPSAPVEPRAGYLVTVREGVKAAFYLALEEAERGAQINLIPGETRIIYYIKPVGIVTLEMKIRRVGRVRKARP